MAFFALQAAHSYEEMQDKIGTNYEKPTAQASKSFFLFIFILKDFCDL